MEYSGLLRVFTDLTIHGKLPGEGSVAFLEHGPGKDEFLISIIDDDKSLRDSTKQLLRSAGYQVATFDSAESFLDTEATNKTQCIILDLRMPGIDGLEFQRRLNSSGVDVPLVFVTAHDDASGRGQATEAGAIDFLNKPFEANTLLSTIETALTRQDVHGRSAQCHGAGEGTSK
jgi:FixJ family two-component response regulator